MAIKTEHSSRKHIKESRGTKYRYRCPHCDSTRIRKRQTNHWQKRFKEYQELNRVERQQKNSLEISSYYCRSCQTPLDATERVDTANSSDNGSFYYDSEVNTVSKSWIAIARRTDKAHRDEDILRGLYHVEELRLQAMTDILDVADSTLRRWMNKYDIERDEYRYFDNSNE